MVSAGTPRSVGNAFTIAGHAGEHGDRGAVWRLSEDDRDLDTNIVRVAPHDHIGPHDGPDLDVLILVLAGTGDLATPATAPITLTAGELIWLPRHGRRHFTAGPTGLIYLTVHRRRPKLSITTRAAQPQ